MIVHQIDVQRKGGLCSRYPVSCIIRMLLREAGLLEPFKTITVLDLTYGEGRFWVTLPQAYIIAFDIRRLKWHRKPQVFYNKPCWKFGDYVTKVDIIVIDPPWGEWRRGWDRRGHYIKFNALGSPQQILQCGLDAMQKLGKPLLYHYKQPLDYQHLAGPIEFYGRSRLAVIKKPSYFGVIF